MQRVLRCLYAFFVVATRHPTDAWVDRQLRETTPFDERQRYLIRGNDRKYHPAFAHAVAITGIVELRPVYRTPRQKATCERLLGSVRSKCSDNLLILGEGHLRRVVREYMPTTTATDFIRDCIGRSPRHPDR